MHFQPLSPSPFPRKQGKGSDLPLPAGGEGPQGGVNAPHMALRASRCAERVKFITRSSNPASARARQGVAPVYSQIAPGQKVEGRQAVRLIGRPPNASHAAVRS